ncbi:MAG: sulfite exporter TauE/SafE family protein [Thermoclostridium sp.]|nr:sulfite exporter TauE/SafE family protein [Thermoclostridium sp.]
MLEILLGFISGMISGMGMGGGTILIPGLVLFAGIEQKTAQGINLLYFIPSAIAALVLHIKNRHIRKEFLVFLIGGGLLGAFFGSYMAVRFSNGLLQKIFAVFLTMMGIYEFFCKDKEENREKDMEEAKDEKREDCQNINTYS